MLLNSVALQHLPGLGIPITDTVDRALDTIIAYASDLIQRGRQRK